MKRALLYVAVLLSFSAQAQKNIKTSDEFTITGQIEKELKFTLSDLSKYAQHNVGDLIITNHLGEKKGTAKALTGILLKDILNEVQFKTESPKVLSEFYLTFIATDGYKVVYSWNEIFNTPTGDNIFLITEKEGKKVKDMDDRILIVTITDFKTGRRNIKGLSQIRISRVE